jgi:ATP-binding protein involved in chromosome partitioning
MGGAALTLTQLAPLSGAVIVTTANELSLVDARKGLKMFEKVAVPVLGIVENMSFFTPPDFPDRRYYPFWSRRWRTSRGRPPSAQGPFGAPVTEKVRILGDQARIEMGNCGSVWLPK